MLTAFRTLLRPVSIVERVSVTPFPKSSPLKLCIAFSVVFRELTASPFLLAISALEGLLTETIPTIAE